MLIFWIICSLLLIVALVIVLPALITKEAPKDVDRKRINTAVFEKKRIELENDRRNDLIDQDQYKVAKADLERALLDDLENDQQIVFKSSNKLLPIIIIICLPLVTVLVYLQLENGLQSLDPEFKNKMASQQSSRPTSVEEAIAQLEEKVKRDSNNLESWNMLGRSYLVTKRFDDAVNAYSRANELTNGADPNVLISYGEAQVFAAGNKFDENSLSLFNKALQIQPNNERGLWYAGMAAYQLKNYQGAINYWEKLIAQVSDDQADVKSALGKYLNDAKEKAGIEITLNTEKDTSSSDSNSKIIVNVTLSDELLKKTVSSDTLFIYARAMNGPKMPLALVKLTAGDLPTTVTLDDSVSMMSGMTLSSMEQVEVVARISKSGQAVMQTGDIFGSVQSVKTDQSETVDVVISELVP